MAVRDVGCPRTTNSIGGARVRLYQAEDVPIENLMDLMILIEVLIAGLALVDAACKFVSALRTAL